jgi:hypothetical protein
MATKLNKGQIVILAMFAVVAIYAGALVLMNEPTPWRDIPEEGMSRNGLAFSEEIAHYESLARVGDPATIAAILDMLAPGEPPSEPGCAPVKRDATLHVIAHRADGSVFGYVVLQAGRITAAGPADAKDCTIAWFHQKGEFISWELYDARARLTEITGVQM